MRQLNLKHNQKGVSLLEYALIAALIAVVCVTAITAIGSNADVKLGNVASSLSIL